MLKKPLNPMLIITLQSISLKQSLKYLFVLMHRSMGRNMIKTRHEIIILHKQNDTFGYFAIYTQQYIIMIFHNNYIVVFKCIFVISKGSCSTSSTQVRYAVGNFLSISNNMHSNEQFWFYVPILCILLLL